MMSRTFITFYIYYIRRYVCLSVCLSACVYVCLSAHNSGTGRAIVSKFSG